jgi:hypothetical protein
LYVAEVLRHCGDTYHDFSTEVLLYWMRSIVTPESKLRFQHILTKALLKIDSSNKLLYNLPFVSERSQISLSEFKASRESLITQVLLNIRKAVDNRESPAIDADTRRQAVGLLNEIMQSMKMHVKALDNNEKNSYTKFVHKVLSAMQAYTVAIKPLDVFFTDSPAFPLNIFDPEFIVGKLKGYGLTLTTPGGGTKLVYFVLNMTQRTAFQQNESTKTYFKDTLYTVLSDFSWIGYDEKSRLREIMLQAIFPAYWELAVLHSLGELAAQPFFEVTEKLMDDACIELAFYRDRSSSLSNSMAAMLKSLQISIEPVVDGPALLESSKVLNILSSVFRICTASASAIDAMRHSDTFAACFEQCVSSLRFFFRLSAFLGQFILSNTIGPDPRTNPDISDIPYSPEAQITKIKDIMLTELQSTLNNPAYALHVNAVDSKTAKDRLWIALKSFQEQLAWFDSKVIRKRVVKEPFKIAFK